MAKIEPTIIQLIWSLLSLTMFIAWPTFVIYCGIQTLNYMNGQKEKYAYALPVPPISFDVESSLVTDKPYVYKPQNFPAYIAPDYWFTMDWTQVEANWDKLETFSWTLEVTNTSSISFTAVLGNPFEYEIAKEICTKLNMKLISYRSDQERDKTHIYFRDILRNKLNEVFKRYIWTSVEVVDETFNKTWTDLKIENNLKATKSCADYWKEIDSKSTEYDKKVVGLKSYGWPAALAVVLDYQIMDSSSSELGCGKLAWQQLVFETEKKLTEEEKRKIKKGPRPKFYTVCRS